MTCPYCEEPVQPDSAEALADHFWLFHPREYDQMAKWPDGRLAIIDERQVPRDSDHHGGSRP